MYNITRYFRDIIAVADRPSIVFKDDLFITVEDAQIERGYIANAEIQNLFISEKSGEMKSYSQNVVIALRTLATKIEEGQSLYNEGLEDLSAIFLVPAKLDINGTLMIPEQGKRPWIPREYLRPLFDEQITVGSQKDYNDYIKQRDKYYHIENWNDYFEYSKEMYETVTKTPYTEKKINNSTKDIQVDLKCYIFLDKMVNTTKSILKLYDFLLEARVENKLYQKMTNGIVEAERKLISNSSVEKMKRHYGQMGAEFPLSDSQRMSLNHFSELRDGDVLAVSGPPGTGKTTLLQSVVADMFVEHALNQKRPPIIVAASTNNQAVTNIIDSFQKINAVGISNLEKRWVKGVFSFATYFPAASKKGQAIEKGYQYSSSRGEGFICTVEDLENRKISTKCMVAMCEEFFSKKEMNLGMCKYYIFQRLKMINRLKNDFIDNWVSLMQETNNMGYRVFETEISKQLKKAEEEKNNAEKEKNKCICEWNYCIKRLRQWDEAYRSNNWIFRLCMFFSKRKRITWINSFKEERELRYLIGKKSLEEILDTYNLQIEICETEKEKKEEIYQKEEEEYRKILTKKINIDRKMQLIRDIVENLRKYDVQVFKSYQEQNKVLEDGNLEKINLLLDKSVRYVMFWLAVHYYEALWLIEESKFSDTQKATTLEDVLKERYERHAMLSPCMVMTFYTLPNLFCAYNMNEKKKFYMFDAIDLLIVDEAGQISPEIAMGSFNLAKKAIVVGDEQQIDPVWSVSRVLDASVAWECHVINNSIGYKWIENNGLNCSSSSIMKIATQSCAYNYQNGEQKIQGLFLCEHRRCYNEIIEYCNELVYGGKLKPLRGSFSTDKNILKDFLPAMGYCQVDTEKSRRQNGSRCNREEAQAIITWIQNNYEKICELYRENEKEDFKANQVLGIITPFRMQAVIIRKLLTQTLPHFSSQISVGTVHTFQGAERKIIIFSSVYGKKDGCYFIDYKANLMNVAVSRAKDSFLHFGDRECLVGGGRSASGLLKRMVDIQIND